jgi:lipopolysaccharide export system permease protein
MWQWYYADTATWQGQDLIMRNMVNYNSDGHRTIRLGEFRYHVGRALNEIVTYEQDPNDMSMAQIREQIRQLAAVDPRDPKVRSLTEELHTHAALPWCALGFALLGAPLGLRPHRTGPGMGLGISLAIILLYVIASNLLGVVGRQGALPPVLAAWAPNVTLYLIGLGLAWDKIR